MNAKQYRLQRDAALRRAWNAEDCLKDIKKICDGVTMAYLANEAVGNIEARIEAANISWPPPGSPAPVEETSRG